MDTNPMVKGLVEYLQTMDEADRKPTLEQSLESVQAKILEHTLQLDKHERLLNMAIESKLVIFGAAAYFGIQFEIERKPETEGEAIIDA